MESSERQQLVHGLRYNFARMTQAYCVSALLKKCTEHNNIA